MNAKDGTLSTFLAAIAAGGILDNPMHRSRRSPVTGRRPNHISKPFGNPSNHMNCTSRRHKDWYHSANQANEIARDKRIAKLHRDLSLAS